MLLANKPKRFKTTIVKADSPMAAIIIVAAIQEIKPCQFLLSPVGAFLFSKVVLSF
jgi:hypothetical protein